MAAAALGVALEVVDKDGAVAKKECSSEGVEHGKG